MLIAILITAAISLMTLAGALMIERGRHKAASACSKEILKAIPDLMFRISAEGVYLDFHGDERQLFAPPAQFLGKTFRDIMPRELAEKFDAAFQQARASGEAQVVEYSLPINGEDRTYEARIVACEDRSVLSFVRDTTTWRKVEKSLFAQTLELKQSHEHVRDLGGRLIAAQELERARIARDLHDDLGQKLALLSIEIDRPTRSGPRSALDISQLLGELKSRVGEISGDVHRLSYELHPSKLKTLGLVAAIDSCCREMSNQHGLAVAFRRERVPPDVDDDVALCLYRVVQEALHNIVKHSGAQAAEVWLASDNGELELRIADRGRGFTSGTHADGLGLVSMRERVQFLRGRFIVRSSPGGGTRIGVRIPLSVARAQSASAGAYSA